MKYILLFLSFNFCTLCVDALPWATYNGGSISENSQSIATDTNGNVFALVWTSSTSADAYVVKYNSSGVLQWTTNYGGTGSETGYGITTDKNGNIYITGRTNSSTGIATTGMHQTTYGGGHDAFLIKINPSGTILWGTYYGGTGSDAGYGIKLDTSGNIFITGITQSTTGIASSGSHQTSYGGGNWNTFIVKFNSSGVRQWGTYYGANLETYGQGITTDVAGNCYIVGWTSDTSAIATSGAYQTTAAGTDAFIVKFNSTGTRQWGTYYGGSGLDYGYGITTDVAGNILITGQTGASAGISSSGTHQTTYGGGNDAFIAKFSSAGSRVWATYYGGSGYDWGNSISTDANDNVFITGWTASTSAIATSGAYQTSFGGGTYDVFVLKLNSSGARQWGSYYGGSGSERGWGTSIDKNGNLLVTGETSSSSGIATTSSYQDTYGGGSSDAFVTSFTNNGSLPVHLISFNVSALKDKEVTKVLCKWQTASEINNEYFSVQRSKDGEHFEEIGQIQGAGNTISIVSYDFTDQTPGKGILYYRLKQTDFDGRSSLSETKVIDLSYTLSLPVSLVYADNIPTLKFSSIGNQRFTTELFSFRGASVWASSNLTAEGDNSFTLPRNVSRGLYLLRTQFAGQDQYFKVWIE
jgi:hypothetical protein